MKNTFRRFINSILLVVIGALVGAGLLSAVYLLPISQEKHDIVTKQLIEQGWYPRESVKLPTLDENFHSFYPDVLDYGTDKLIVETSAQVYQRPASVKEALQHALSGRNDVEDYAIYWHGYALLLRPLFRFLDLSEVHILNGMLQLLLTVTIILVISRKKDWRYGVAFTVSYLFLMPSAMSQAFQYSPVFYLLAFFTLILICNPEKVIEKKRFVYLFILAGLLTSYLDLLTFPLLTWGIPVAWWIVMQDEKSAKVHLLQVVQSGIAWIFGYAGMWAFKWPISSWALEYDVWEIAKREIFYMSGNSADNAYSSKEHLNAFLLNWKHYAYAPYAILIMVCVAVGIYLLIRYRQKTNQKSLAYLLIGSSVVAWYFVLAAHTCIHHIFTYRIYVIVITVYAILLLEILGDKEGVYGETVDRNKKYILKKIGLLASIAVVAVLFLCVTRETTEVNNLASNFTETTIQPGTVIAQSFVPTHNHITAYGFGLKSDDQEGTYVVELKDGEKTIARDEFAVADFGGSNYHVFPVDWKCKAGREYRITIDTSACKTPVVKYVTDDEQLLNRLDYWGTPESKSFLAFMWISYVGLGILLYCGIVSFFRKKNYEKR